MVENDKTGSDGDDDEVPILYDRRCPRCGSLGAYVGADDCAVCQVKLVAVPVQRALGPPTPVHVYRPWVGWLLAAIAVATPFAPIPFLDGIPGFAVKLILAATFVRIMRAYREDKPH